MWQKVYSVSTMAVLRRASGEVLASEVSFATTPLRRMRGLIGSRGGRAGWALVIEPAKQVHTFGMGYPIDAVFTDPAWTVLHVARMPPWRLSRWVSGARRVIELPEGAATGLEPGEALALEA